MISQRADLTHGPTDAPRRFNRRGANSYMELYMRWPLFVPFQQKCKNKQELAAKYGKESITVHPSFYPYRSMMDFQNLQKEQK